MTRRLRVLLLAGFAVTGCAERTEKPPKKALPLVVSVDASTVTPVDPKVLALAREALGKAKAIAAGCTLQQQGDSYDLDFERFGEICLAKDEELKAFDRASDALLASTPDAGPAASFAENVRLFDEALHLTFARRGVLVHWQDLAHAWNSFQPGEAVPVDIGKMGFGTERLRADAGALVWGRCSDGPCIVIPKKRETRH